MTLFFNLPESPTCSGACVADHTSSERYVNRRMGWVAACLDALKSPPMTQDERADHASKVAAVRFKDECKRRDLLSQ